MRALIDLFKSNETTTPLSEGPFGFIKGLTKPSEPTPGGELQRFVVTYDWKGDEQHVTIEAEDARAARNQAMRKLNKDTIILSVVKQTVDSAPTRSLNGLTPQQVETAKGVLRYFDGIDLKQFWDQYEKAACDKSRPFQAYEVAHRLAKRLKAGTP